jgi:hypothetical protein
MTLLRYIAIGYAFALGFAALLNYIPGLTDDQGRSFGIFALDKFDDALHVASASWAAVSAWLSHRASKNFLFYFGILYFADGALGLATGSGYLDFGLVKYGIQDLPMSFKILANLPHIFLGGFAFLSSKFLDNKGA